MRRHRPAQPVFSLRAVTKPAATRARRMSTQHPDVIVVGAGLGGLVTAALLARSGRKVRVLEQSKKLGGLARTRKQHGFAFNRGPRALYRNGSAHKTLQGLGIPLAGSSPAISGVVYDQGGTHHLPASFGAMLTTSLLSWRGRWVLGKTLASIRGLDPREFATLSAQAWIDASVAEPTAARFIAAMFRLTSYAGTLDLLSADAALGQLQAAVRHGVLYLDGGWQTIVDNLQRVCEQSGVQFETSARVCEVATGGLRRTDGTELEAKDIVLALPPQEVWALTKTQPHTRSTTSAACLDLALDRLPRPRAAGGHTFGLDLDARLYCSVHSQWAKLAPEQGALMHVLHYHGTTPMDAETSRATLEAFAEQVQPGWKDHLVAQQFLPDITVSHLIPTAHQGGLAGRPGPDATGCEHVYAVGDWVGPTSMLADAVLASATQVATLLGAGSVQRDVA